jgi:hypothetical protein
MSDVPGERREDEAPPPTDVAPEPPPESPPEPEQLPPSYANIAEPPYREPTPEEEAAAYAEIRGTDDPAEVERRRLATLEELARAKTGVPLDQIEPMYRERPSPGEEAEIYADVRPGMPDAEEVEDRREEALEGIERGPPIRGGPRTEQSPEELAEIQAVPVPPADGYRLDEREMATGQFFPGVGRLPAAPIISSLEPNTAAIGSYVVCVIKGAGCVPGSVVTFGGQDQNTDIGPDGPGSLIFMPPDPPADGAGDYDVTVRAPDGAISEPSIFTFT